MNGPWSDWIPGALSNSQLRLLCKDAYIDGVNGWEDKTDGPVGYSAIDLTLSNEAHRMVRGSVKPFRDRYEHGVISQGLAERLDPDDDGAYILKRTNTYLFKLKERIRFKEEARLHGQATAKSTIGRMDVLARLIVDGMDCYEAFDPLGLDRGSGEMYLEITPMTFNVRVKEGIKLSQLRLFRGNPEDSKIVGEDVFEPLLHREDDQRIDGSLSVDLEETDVRGHNVCAFWANRADEDDEPIDLWAHEEGQKPLPCEHWRFLRTGQDKRVRIEKDHFYIMRSKERISLPGSVAVYCRATDETIGEMRIHYAGFVHPHFGQNRRDGQKGTSLIFEVRGHDVDVSLRDGEKMAQLVFYRMSEPTGDQEQEHSQEEKDPYNNQILRLSKIFADWPNKMEVSSDGTVKNLEV